MMPQVTFGTKSSICIIPGSEEQAKQLFDGLSKGGQVGIPLEIMFWGALFGFFNNKFGIQWMVN